mgnify:CR=1 FL=1
MDIYKLERKEQIKKCSVMPLGLTQSDFLAKIDKLLNRAKKTP